MSKIGFKINKSPSGITDVSGFSVGSAAADIRRNGNNQRLDVGVLYSELPCHAAGVFTINAIAAAPVKVCRAILEHGGPFHAIVANSGNANACTGDQGLLDAIRMQEKVAEGLECSSEAVFVCSTGRIGRAMPMTHVESGIEKAVSVLSKTKKAGFGFADAILTSDTRRKVVSVEVETANGTVTIGGVAKGAGMIEPNMATMLAFIATDALIPEKTLQRHLAKAVNDSFNAITVDGDMSTNDTVLLLANGATGVKIDKDSRPHFEAALAYVCEELARKIVGDGEKITKVVELRVTGARDTTQAEMVARAIGNSLLVKSSWYGEDPNWGRLLDAAGYSGAEMIEEKITLAYRASDKKKPVIAFVQGLGQEKNASQWKSIVKGKTFIIELDLALGKGETRLFSSDLTEGYVNFNKSE